MTSWSGVIARNKKLLLPIIEMMIAAISYTGSDGLVPWRTYRYVRRTVRALEAAVRRLIVIAARDLETIVPKARTAPTESDFSWRPPKGALPGRTPSFPLIDPHKNFRFDAQRKTPRHPPRLSVAGLGPAPVAPPLPLRAAGFNPARLQGRLNALQQALATIPVRPNGWRGSADAARCARRGRARWARCGPACRRAIGGAGPKRSMTFFWNVTEWQSTPYAGRTDRSYSPQH